MKIRLNSIIVEDQDKALRFYTETLGFVKKQDIPFGEFRWLTVVSPEEPNGTELVAVKEQGIPLTALAVDNIQAEYDRLRRLGVAFKTPPTPMGPVTLAMFDDTCGNWIQMYQV